MKTLNSEYEYQRALLRLSRENRANATLEEKLMWEELRNRKLGGFKFVRQHVIKNFIVDFFCCQCGLIVEIDGTQHLTEEIAMKDLDRDQWLTGLGYIVLRISNITVRNNVSIALQKVLGTCILRQNFKKTSHMNVFKP